MTAATRVLVRQRADHRCEYCQTHQEDSPLAALHIEHIRPLNHGGTDDETKIGRTTVRVLCMNSDEQLELRMAGE